MVFKNRADAARKLLVHLKPKGQVVVSLLRGGVVIGAILAKALKSIHVPLPVSKISAPHNEELAIGAVCFDMVYLEGPIINRLGVPRSHISKQIRLAKEKFSSYLDRFEIKPSFRLVRSQTVILVDDGIATGATVRAALLYLKKHRPKKIVLAAPVAPAEFDTRGFDEVVILHQDTNFSSISRFYSEFPQVSDREVKKLLH